MDDQAVLLYHDKKNTAEYWEDKGRYEILVGGAEMRYIVIGRADILTICEVEVYRGKS